jgi:hypothetical protein
LKGDREKVRNSLQFQQKFVYPRGWEGKLKPQPQGKSNDRLTDLTMDKPTFLRRLKPSMGI